MSNHDAALGASDLQLRSGALSVTITHMADEQTQLTLQAAQLSKWKAAMEAERALIVAASSAATSESAEETALATALSTVDGEFDELKNEEYELETLRRELAHRAHVSDGERDAVARLQADEAAVAAAAAGTADDGPVGSTPSAIAEVGSEDDEEVRQLRDQASHLHDTQNHLAHETQRLSERRAAVARKITELAAAATPPAASAGDDSGAQSAEGEGTADAAGGEPSSQAGREGSSAEGTLPQLSAARLASLEASSERITVTLASLASRQLRLSEEEQLVLARMHLHDEGHALHSKLNALSANMANHIEVFQASLADDPTDDERLQIEAFFCNQFHLSPTRGLRQYAAGMELIVKHGSRWIEADVIAPPEESWGLAHQLQGVDAVLTMKLHPFNHAPRLMPITSYDSMRSRYERSMRTQHSTVLDALSGKRLDVQKQMVPISMRVGGRALVEAPSFVRRPTTALKSLKRAVTKSFSKGTTADLHRVDSVNALGSWFEDSYQRRQRRPQTTDAACIFITASPAAGKSCLMSQLVIESLGGHSELVPVFIKVQQLHARLQEEENLDAFSNAWNCVLASRPASARRVCSTHCCSHGSLEPPDRAATPLQGLMLTSSSCTARIRTCTSSSARP